MQMSETVTYYEILLADGSGNNPAGLARRRELDHGAVEDEMLRRDMSWQPDSLIVEWKRGDSVEELREISADEAAGLVERFRQRWAE
jgi:hypothetical protein